MSFRRVHPLAVGVVILALIVSSFFAGYAYAEPASSQRETGSTSSTSPPVFRSPVPVSLTGAETAVAVRAWEMQLGAWWAAVAANMVAEATVIRPEVVTPRLNTAPPGGSSGTGHAVPCGTPGSPTQNPDAIPSYIVQRESQHTVDAWNCSSTASGKYQMLDSTFASCGTGYQSAWQAPESVQDACAASLPLSHWGG